jgi:nitroreductase
MNLDEYIQERRSCRAYKDTPVPKDIVDKLLDAGVWAPSAFNAQPWKFVVIQDTEIINNLSAKTTEIVSQMDWEAARKTIDYAQFFGAPLVILMCVEKIEGTLRDVKLLDCGLACQNMFLKAHDLGLGSCFIGWARVLNMQPEILDEVGVPRDHELIAPLIFGYPAEEPSAPPREIKMLNWIE